MENLWPQCMPSSRICSLLSKYHSTSKTICPEDTLAYLIYKELCAQSPNYSEANCIWGGSEEVSLCSPNCSRLWSSFHVVLRGHSWSLKSSVVTLWEHEWLRVMWKGSQKYIWPLVQTGSSSTNSITVGWICGWMNPQVSRVDCMSTFYIKDLSVRGFGYPQGSWN